MSFGITITVLLSGDIQSSKKSLYAEKSCYIINVEIILRGKYKMAQNERFEKIYEQGIFSVIEIWVDKETGVNYMFRRDGNAGGMTPLLDKDGNVVVTPTIK